MSIIVEEVSERQDPDGGIEPRPGNRRRRRRHGNVGFVFGVSWLVVWLVLAIVADVLPLRDPEAGVGPPRLAPLREIAFPLGTDALGRDVASRLIYGARVSLSVGVLSVLLAMVIGSVLGLVGGLFGRWVDRTVGILTDAALAFPSLILLLALVATLGPGSGTLIIGLTLITLPRFVRISRSSTLRFVEREFVKASRMLGATRSRLMFRVLLPNIVPSIVTFGISVCAATITAESSLSYLGIGIRPPTPSWGVMIGQGQAELRDHPLLTFVPALVLFVTVFCIDVVGERLRGVVTASSRVEGRP